MKIIRINYNLFVLCLLAGLLLTCNNPFAPGTADENERGSLLLTSQRNPDEVLQNFQYAYTFKDSLVYSELFDSTFTFISTNFNVSPPEPIVWGRDQELRTVGRMFRFFNTLDLTFNSVIDRDTLEFSAGDNLPLRIEDNITFTLTLDGGSTIPTLLGEVIFVYVRRENRWLISRWEDKQI
ncbi:MAG: hypothetical protein KDI38_17365 [Calditrichaeota bacterium]|nr:hypothetical protein [Calditrichota bacterium]MCB0305534.1 hypothetical protein [Calditrichota bacterium]MCB0311942.1 hypothetical protein [Calditrichota bacterium]MCB9088976.1 hypothetical protein [Calditrichia bacterium]